MQFYVQKFTGGGLSKQNVVILRQEIINLQMLSVQC